MRGPGEIVRTVAKRMAAKTALVTTRRSLTYGELDELADRVANALRDRGVRPGDRVALIGQNRWEWIVTYHGILRSGAIVNPLTVCRRT